jgi:hypothetical protein
MTGVGYERHRLVHKLMCRLRGHTGMIVPAWIGRRPSNTWLFENARCRRCGEYRWP